MQFALWAYPWDLLDEGVKSVAERCAEIGVDELNLATNYHAVQPFLPHNPERTTFFAHASSYFHPDERHYGRLSPIPNERMGDEDWLSRISNEIADTHLSMNSWTIGCHNSRLGMANPDLTLKSPFGDSLAFGLCPSKPEVQEYLCSVLSDLSARASFERIELETFDYFYGTGFGWHHDKYHLELGRLGEFLFGLCFCDECCENARDAGVNVDAAQESAQVGVNAIIDGDLPPDMSLAGWLRTHSELTAYIDTRMRSLTDLYADLRSATNEDIELGRYTGFFNVDNAWMHGADLNALAAHLDYYTVIAYEASQRAAVQRARTADRFTPNISLHAGILPGYPAVDGAETVQSIVDGLAAAGVERISFYNYGLLPEQNLDWIGAATEPYR
jgi:hypothetical protein